MTGAPAARLPRSYLFVPGDRPERYAKAIASGADAVIVDLEDAVAPERKPGARDVLATALSEDLPAVIVRINAAGTPWFEDDLKLCRHPAVAAVMLPKAEDIEPVCAIVEQSYKDVLPLIESARGIERVAAIARVPGVRRLVFGSIDLGVDLGLETAPGGDQQELIFYRSQLVLASRLAGLDAPVDGVSTAIDDAAQLSTEAAHARRLGFGAKLCIHPKQLAAIHAVFTPSAERVHWARRVAAAFDAAGGSAFALDGQMIDRPVYLRALAVLRSAGEASQTDMPGQMR